MRYFHETQILFALAKYSRSLRNGKKNFHRNKFKTLLSFLTKKREITLKSCSFVSKYWTCYLFDLKVTYLQIYYCSAVRIEIWLKLWFSHVSKVIGVQNTLQFHSYDFLDSRNDLKDFNKRVKTDIEQWKQKQEGTKRNKRGSLRNCFFNWHIVAWQQTSSLRTRRRKREAGKVARGADGEEERVV